MLINIFGTEIKKDVRDEISNEIIYSQRTVSDSTRDTLNSSFDKLNSWKTKTLLPVWLVIIKYIALFLALCITFGIFKADVSLSKAFENAGYLFFIGGICWIILIAIIIYNFKLERKVIQSDELSADLSDLDNISRLACQELGIPENAESIDVLCEKYKIKDNKVKHINYSAFSHLNLDRFIYVQNDTIYIANLYSVIEFPIDSVISITPEKKKATLPVWNKTIPLDDESLEKYNIQRDNHGLIITNYYKITVKTSNREFYFLIPDYDIELFGNITDINIDKSL